MSTTACVHIVETAKPGYRPTVAQLRSMCEFLHISALRVVEIYERKLTWEDEDNEDSPITSTWNMPLDDALAEYRSYLGKYPRSTPIRLSAAFNDWAADFADHFSYIPDDISGHFAPADFMFIIGDADIPSVDFERVQYTSHFQLEMYGNQMPLEFDTYLEMLESDARITALLQHLSSLEEGLCYRLFMSAYY